MITYRASRQTLAVLVGVGLGVVLFGVFGAVIFKGSLQEQYFATIAIGLGVIFMPLSRRLGGSDIYDAHAIGTHLPFQQFGTPHRHRRYCWSCSRSVPREGSTRHHVSRVDAGVLATRRNPLLIGRHDQLRDSCQ